MNLVRTDTRMTAKMKAAVIKYADKVSLRFSDIVRQAVAEHLDRLQIKWR